MTAAVLLLTVALAAANGANDVSKGVATLAGAGVTRYRTAILWGSAATLAGSVASLHLASRLNTLFSKGIVTESPTPAFALAVLVGAGAWVAFATATRLPVSTTHAIVGALVGAGLVLGADAVAWGAVGQRVALPLLAGIGASYAVSMALNLARARVPECVCVSATAPPPTVAAPEGAALASAAWPGIRVEAGTVAECRLHRDHSRRMTLTVDGAHWLSSGAASFARGLSDTPKIVAIGAFALVPAGFAPRQVVLVVALAMATGSLVAGSRVARRLGEGVVQMQHAEGFRANLTTAALVGLAANRGLPLSTTHVSTGAIAGTAGADVSRLHVGTLRDFAVAWTLTPVAAGSVAAGALALAG